ncbi:MAG TPA: hypothetical protein VM659_17020 [Dongiaceae bacterium]|nr:hypothetical protein [Dongiaceae bacterium]
MQIRPPEQKGPDQNRPDQNRPNPGMPGSRLGIIQLVTTSLQSLWVCRDDALRLGVVPMIIYFAAMFYGRPAALAVMDALQGGSAGLARSVGGDLLLSGLVAVCSFALLAVNWLRFLLLGPQKAAGLGLHLTRAHLQYLLGVIALGFAALLGLSLLSLPIQFLPPLLARIGLWVAALVVGLTAIRLSLALVAIAISQPVGLRQAWEASRGQGFVLLIAFLLAQIPFMLAVMVIGVIAGVTGLADAAPYTLLLLGCICQIGATMTQTGILAAAYRRLIGVRA